MRKIYQVPEIGSKFGLWTTVSQTLEYIYPRKHYTKGLRVRCECGNEGVVPLSVLISEQSNGCTSCGVARKFKGTGNLSQSYIAQIMVGVRSRGLEFDVSTEYLWELFLSQDKRCRFTNLELIMDPKYSMNGKENVIQTASLDRIDSSKGYIEGNVQWVHKIVNIMKNNLPDDKFIRICKMVAKNN